jgi:hypothetical protein
LTDDAGTTTFTLSGEDDYQWQLATSSFGTGTLFTTLRIDETTLAASVPATATYGSLLTVESYLGNATLKEQVGGYFPVGNAYVSLYRTMPGEDPELVENSGNSNDNGVTKFIVPTTATASYRLLFTGDRNHAGTSLELGTITITRAASLTLTAAPQVPFATAAKLTGRLTWSDTAAPITAIPVEVWAAAGTGAWVHTGSSVTAVDGTVSVAPVVSSNTRYQLRLPALTIGPVTATAAVSPVVAVTSLRTGVATVAVSTARAVAGTRVGVTGKLTWRGSTSVLRSQPVQLWGRAANGAWTRVAFGTTSAAGVATWSVTPKYTTSYQLRYSGGGVDGSWQAAAATSAGVTSRVVAKVSVTAPTTAKVTTAYKVTGKVVPAFLGGKVAVQVNSRTVANVTTSSTGAFTATLKFPRGTPTVRALVPTSVYSDSAYSSTRKVSVK